ncbi:MAG TPA: hypothetical protein VF520_11305 [Thermoleophilaceae bacterium]|jgi:opacity protein-like surface antigen
MGIRIALAVAAAACLLAPAGASAATDASTDTFNGTCAGMSGFVHWPDSTLTNTPGFKRMLVEFDSGRCTGTLNGQPVTNAPGRLDGELQGIQACGGGLQTGRLQLTIDGVSIEADATYRRVLTAPTVVFDGDAGGSAIAVARALIDLADSVRVCNGAGYSTVPIVVDEFRTAPQIASP